MKNKERALKGVYTGVLTGVANGLFGGGGGMIAVPLLKRLLGYSERQSHATAILIIAPICLASSLVYVFNGYIRADIVIPAAAGSVAGGLLGALALGKLPEELVNIAFIAAMLVAGIRLVL